MASVAFKGGQVLFRQGRVFFGPPCCGNCSQPTAGCVLLRRSDFSVCGSCTPGGGGCGVLPLWTGLLNLSGGVWSCPLSCTPSGRNVFATITVSGGTYTLTVFCEDSSIVWQGSQTSGAPTGTYLRASGCDTSTQMVVF